MFQTPHLLTTPAERFQNEVLQARGNQDTLLAALKNSTTTIIHENWDTLNKAYSSILAKEIHFQERFKILSLSTNERELLLHQIGTFKKLQTEILDLLKMKADSTHPLNITSVSKGIFEKIGSFFKGITDTAFNKKHALLGSAVILTSSTKIGLKFLKNVSKIAGKNLPILGAVFSAIWAIPTAVDQFGRGNTLRGITTLALGTISAIAPYCL